MGKPTECFLTRNVLSEQESRAVRTVPTRRGLQASAHEPRYRSQFAIRGLALWMRLPHKDVTCATSSAWPSGRFLERLIVRTALGCHLRSRRSVQRFERDTYHGDALPTELRGPVFSCLTWGFAPHGGHSGRALRVIRRWSNSTPETKLPSPGVGEPTALLPSWRPTRGCATCRPAPSLLTPTMRLCWRLLATKGMPTAHPELPPAT